MSKKIIIAVSIVFGLLLAGVFGGAWYFSTQLVHPKTGTCDPAHFQFCGPADEVGIPFEDVTFRSNDGLELSGWFFPAKGSMKGIVMVHGITADRHEGMRWVKSLHAAGFNLLLFDLRNHGKSGTAPANAMGIIEKNDVMGAVTFLKDAKKLENVGVFGVSMGAASSILAMAEDKRIEAGVFEAGFANLRDLLSDMGKRDFGLPPFPLMNALAILFRIRSGHSMDMANPEDYIGKIAPRPVLIIHCPGDNYIPYSHGERNFAAAKEPKEMWDAPCDMHARAYQSDVATAEKKAADFFKRNVQ